MQTTLDDFNGGATDRLVMPTVQGIPMSSTLLGKLLLVDDEADGAEFAAMLLRSHGLQVTVVHSAIEALQALQNDKDFNAVLSDIRMPGMSGLQLAETIREKYPAIKIVLMSGYVSPGLLKEQQPPYLFASKPYRIDTILKLLQS